MSRALSWERRIATILRALRAERIRDRFVMFAAVATLIPSLSTAAVSYVQNRRALTLKIAETLRAASSQGAREVDLWMKERLYDVRVFASSYEVSENLDRVQRGDRGAAVRRLGDYLSSVRERFTDYAELIVVDRRGMPVPGSAARGSGTVELPGDWVDQARTRGAIIGRAFWDSVASRPLLTVGVPVTTTDGRFLGALAAKLDLTPVTSSLRAFVAEDSGAIHLVTGTGDLLVSSLGASRALMSRKVEGPTLARLGAEERGVVAYANYRGQDVLGALTPVRQLSWAVVAEIPAAQAYAQIARLRNFALLTVALLLAVTGGLAYLLGLTIVLPLDRLARAARRVAGGDLSLTLPVVGQGEVADATEVFNDMVTRLRQGRAELERLSRTDALTGLPNRRDLMDALQREVQRATRHARRFSVLMIDVDHFKQYNDSFGHLAGDDVLKRLAAVLTAAVRTADYAGRYGGEEFIVVLPETPLEGAVEVADRIRTSMVEQELGAGHSKVTLSIGIGEFPADGETPESVIAGADKALYRAKQAGRDRVEITKAKSQMPDPKRRRGRGKKKP